MAFITKKKDIKKAVKVEGPLSAFLDNFNLIEPGIVAFDILKSDLFHRNANLAQLVVLQGRCCWCNKNDIFPPRKRYCSDDCKESAFVWCNPQSPTSKGWMLLNRQDFSCACCGLSFEEEIRKKIKNYFQMIAKGYYSYLKEHEKYKASLYFIGHNFGHIFNADHKVPLFLGGQGLGLDNVRVLSVHCHQKKTIEEKQKLS